ncbi:MAG: NifU family protein [Acidimicrobiia bacterium]
MQSPLMPERTTDDAIITVTPAARAHVISIRDDEPEGNRLGVRVEIVSDTGPEFGYDLSFQIVAQAALDDVVRNHDGLRVIIPGKDVDNFKGAELDLEDGGLVLRNPNHPKPLVLGALVRDSDLAQGIDLLLDTEINPMLDAHGGYVVLLGHDDENIVYLRMGGGCQGCSMSRMTMVQGVQSSIHERFPEVTKVVDATDHTAGATPYYS